MPEEHWLTRSEAARFLRDRGFPIQASTLAKYATLGGGPMYVKFGRKPLYAESALMEWVQTKTTGPWRSSSEMEREV